MVSKEGLEKFHLGLEADVSNINRHSRKKNCGMTLMNLTTKVFVFESSIRVAKALIIKTALEQKMIQEGDPIIEFLKGEAKLDNLPQHSEFIVDTMPVQDRSMEVPPHTRVDMFLSQCIRCFAILVGGYPINLHFFNYQTK